MINIKRISLYILLSVLPAVALFASGNSTAVAQEPAISVELDRSSLSVGEELELTVRVRGTGEVSPPILPQIEGLDLVESTVTRQIGIAQGQPTTESLHKYRFRATKVGQLTIGAIEVWVGSTKFATEPIQIEVFESSGLPASRAAFVVPEGLAGQDYFAEAVVDNPTPFIGEQVVYTFRYYSKPPLQRLPSYNPPPFTGFWKSTELDPVQFDVISSGQTYHVAEQQTVIFPAVSGTTAIGPASLAVPSGPGGALETIQTLPLSIDVKPLPPGAPVGFDGAVGDFKISADIRSISGDVNQLITLTFTLQGRGNIALLPDPGWPETRELKAFTSTPEVTTRFKDGLLQGTRIYERLLVPQITGDFVLPPIVYAFFDPVAEIYREVSTAGIPISVVLGEDAPIEILAPGLKDIMAAPAVLTSTGRPYTAMPIYWGAWGAPLLVLLTAGAWAWRAQRREANAPLVRQRRARRNARGVLSRARKTGDDPFSASFRSLTGYLGDKLDYPVNGMTEERLCHTLAENGVSDGLVQRVQTCLASDEKGRYEPLSNISGYGATLIDETEQLIADLEKEFKK
ncbi:MAG: protein BatD [Chloroflexi bacterium]|nr:protein BatD [Chloroflexota bacterium]